MEAAADDDPVRGASLAQPDRPADQLLLELPYATAADPTILVMAAHLLS